MAPQHVESLSVDLQALEDTSRAICKLALVKERILVTAAATQVYRVVLGYVLQRAVPIAVQVQAEGLEFFHEEGLVAIEQPGAGKLAATPERANLFYWG
ncbi:hypothetical protein [Bradyrhizobium jicamae]|uniref:hypothetical protein n=1 Tax=Bradyrhizobium jicamae TaxID=280332 RepID=UPI0012EEBDD1|nr:hypothetical protein [Bradyrhizobium jicamae]